METGDQILTQRATGSRRSGGRTARRSLREASDFSMLPGLTRSLPYCEIMDEEQVRRIDDASMSILENVGIVFRDPIALEDWRKAGADVRGVAGPRRLARGARRAVRGVVRGVVRDGHMLCSDRVTL